MDTQVSRIPRLWISEQRQLARWLESYTIHCLDIAGKITPFKIACSLSSGKITPNFALTLIFTGMLEQQLLSGEDGEDKTLKFSHLCR